VESKSPYRSLRDFVADARARPGELTYGSAPAGVINVAFEMLARLGDFKVTFVPFGGTPPAVNALLGGHITAAFVDYPAAAGQLQAGKLRALATGSRERVKELPDVATIAEQGFKDYELDIWYGLFAPAKTPNEVLTRVSGWIREALKAPTVRAKLTPQALDPVGTCGADFARYVGSEYDKFGRAIRELNIKP
jgi:tripartite-type tricarboxylate transporter receptor subunit TctC